MTTTCLRDDALLALHLGEAPAADVRHLEDCPRCMRQLGRLRADLAQIDAHLATPPPPAGRARSPRVLVWAPLTLAAMAALAVVLLYPHGQGPAPAAAYDPEVVVFLDDVEDALDPLAGYDGTEDALEPLGGVGDADLQGRTGTPPVDPAAGGRSTIGLDESFFQVG